MKKRTNPIAVCTIAVGIAAAPVWAAEISTNAALMQAMDKVTGRVNKITVPVNSKIVFGDFSLVLRACKKRPAEETPENFAFVDVADKSFGTDEYNIFRGWMLSSTPGMNAIEHPIYDMWLLECIDTDIDTSKLLTPEELAQRDNLPNKDAVLGKVEPKIVEEKEDALAAEPEKIIHIQEFMQQDRDIEKNIRNAPAYISETAASYVSDVEERGEPQNLLQFTTRKKTQKLPEEKILEGENVATKVKNSDITAKGENDKAHQTNAYDQISNSEDDLSAAIEAEIKGLEQY